MYKFHSFSSLSRTSMKQVLMILASIMAAASGRMLQHTDTENITIIATSSASSAINDIEAQRELIWSVRPQPLPANYKLTATVNPSDEDSIFAYTVAVAGEDASITSHTGSDNSDEDDPVLYYDIYSGTCDVNKTVPTSFMTSKFQVWYSAQAPPSYQPRQRSCVGKHQLGITSTKEPPTNTGRYFRFFTIH